MITKFSHVSLFVLDQDKAYDFYVNKLGFKSAPKEQFYGIEALITDGVGNWFSMTQPK
jgi:catechol 2,3-dioxygenase-like lactoylglutathione lyase family enzyme